MSVCTWTPNAACLSAEWEALTPEEQERSLMLATSSLQMLTYYRVGTCPITVRLCPQTSCGCWGIGSSRADADLTGQAWAAWMPVNWDGQWYNCVTCGSRCAPAHEIDLPGPVGYIDQIKVDGVALDLSTGDWRLDDGHLLVWQGEGPSPIPTTQNLNLPDTMPGTWSITYSQSYPVGEDGELAVAYLAMEFAKACKPKGKCALPRGVTNVVRNGVTFSIQAGLFPGGLTDIDIVDQFILKWAPAGAPTQTAKVLSPRDYLTGNRVRRTNSLPVRGGGS